MDKRCSRCESYKPIDEFSRNRAQKDGRQNQCKACEKLSGQSYQKRNRGKIAAYGRRHRATNAEYHQKRKKAFNETPRGRELQAKYTRQDRERNPEKVAARKKLNHAVGSGKIIRQPCACGNPKTHGHHHDYSKPLEVVWLCIRCHRALHAGA